MPDEYTELKDVDMVLRGWWIQIVRHGMTTTEAVNSLSQYLKDAGYKIVLTSNGL